MGGHVMFLCGLQAGWVGSASCSKICIRVQLFVWLRLKIIWLKKIHQLNKILSNGVAKYIG
jgi:hypothetical protein